MKIMKKRLFLSITALLFSVLFAFLLSSCSSGGNSDTGISVVISETSVTFDGLGLKHTLTVEVIENGVKLDPETVKEELVWTSSRRDIVTVEDGVLSTTGYGTSVIRASFRNASATCNVSNPNPRPPLTVSDHEIALDNIGSNFRIYATSDTGDDVSSEATWKSSNKNIAVCEDGIISAIGYGSCTVTVVYKQKTAVCTVTVKNPTAPAVTLSESELQLSLGQSHILDVRVNNNAGNMITWKSTDPSVAECNDGVITAKSNGTCAIIALSNNGYSDVCIVTAGSGKRPSSHEAYLNFSFKDLGKTLQCADLSLGKISSTVTVIGYNMKTLLLEDGRLVVEISLVCVKTFDADGINGKNPCLVTASLYREGDVFCDKKIYKTENKSVGEVFDMPLAGFTVQTKTDGTAREFYMTFSAVTER